MLLLRKRQKEQFIIIHTFKCPPQANNSSSTVSCQAGEAAEEETEHNSNEVRCSGDRKHTSVGNWV